MLVQSVACIALLGMYKGPCTAAGSTTAKRPRKEKEP